MFDQWRRRFRFRNLEERIENVEDQIEDAKSDKARKERFERSFGGHQADIRYYERKIKRLEKKLHDLRVLQIERDSF